jgi:hypothetical protein
MMIPKSIDLLFDAVGEIERERHGDYPELAEFLTICQSAAAVMHTSLGDPVDAALDKILAGSAPLGLKNYARSMKQALKAASDALHPHVQQASKLLRELDECVRSRDRRSGKRVSPKGLTEEEMLKIGRFFMGAHHAAMVSVERLRDAMKAADKLLICVQTSGS